MRRRGCRGVRLWCRSGQDPANDVAFTACSAVDCAGTLPSGAEFDIIMPEDWNGTLAIFSHQLKRAGCPRIPKSAELATPTATPLVTRARPSARTKKARNKTTRKTPSPSPTPSVSISEIQPRPGGPEVARCGATGTGPWPM